MCKKERNPSHLVALLEKPFHFAKQSGNQDLRATLNAGLNWETDYWINCALKWLDEGAPIDHEIHKKLEALSKNKRHSQKTRHHAFRLSKNWLRNNSVSSKSKSNGIE